MPSSYLPISPHISPYLLQDLMRELGLLDALITMLVAPFTRRGTVAFHELGPP